MYLQEHSYRRNQKWNKLNASVNTVLLPMMEKKLPATGKATKPPPGPKAVESSVRWDVGNACLELEYADVREPGFYCGLMGWYLAGRFPCGWGDRDAGGKIRLYEPTDESGYNPDEPDLLKLVLSYQETQLLNPKVSLPRGGRLIVY